MKLKKERFLVAQGKKNALKLFRLASRRVPAYKHFLRKHKLNPAKIKTINDFKSVPIIDKKNYLYRYSFSDLFIDKKIPPMIYASSGSSGKPTFWFRGDEQEDLGGRIHENIFSNIFGIKKNEPTLVVICFSMGVWVAGNYTMEACRYISRQGYNLTTVTPGVEKEDIFNIFQNLTPHFKNIILAGYPPFLMDVIHEAIRKKVKFKNNIKIITAGDKFSEAWRTEVSRLLHIKEPERSLISIYGSADAGVLGHETPLSIFLRRKSLANKKLYKELFGQVNDVPAFVQYDPTNIFFEEINSELIFTTHTAIPLIRYNIHDIGKIIAYSDIVKLLKEYGLQKEAVQYGLRDWQLPFIVKKDRTDVAVTFYALNIYPENIKAGLENRKVAKLVSGKFIAYNKTLNRHKNQKLCIYVELAPRLKPQ